MSKEKCKCNGGCKTKIEITQEEYDSLLATKAEYEEFNIQQAVNNSDNFVSIPKDQYNQLLEDSEFLGRLEAAGVDNWNGYSEAFEEND